MSLNPFTSSVVSQCMMQQCENTMSRASESLGGCRTFTLQCEFTLHGAMRKALQERASSTMPCTPRAAQSPSMVRGSEPGTMGTRSTLWSSLKRGR